MLEELISMEINLDEMLFFMTVPEDINHHF